MDWAVNPSLKSFAMILTPATRETIRIGMNGVMVAETAQLADSVKKVGWSMWRKKPKANREKEDISLETKRVFSFFVFRKRGREVRSDGG